MIFLVPVSRFRVHYEVAEGFPFSQLQRLILRAVADGVCSKDKLVDTFRIHPRLLIEALVTLTHAGWVALGHTSDKQFLLTPAGSRAVETKELPESTAVNRRHTYVLLERLSGSVIPEGEVRYVTKRVLQKAGVWNSCLEMTAQVLDNKLDESRVQHLLPRQQGQRLHWVGPVDMVTKGDTFIPLSVEPGRELVVNLPQRCERTLRPIVLEAAQHELMRTDGQGVLNWEDLTNSVRLGRGRASNVNVLGMPQQSWKVRWAPDDLVRERDKYDELLTDALSTAQTSALIAGGVVTVTGLSRFETLIMDALHRGVDVDVLCGFGDDPEATDWLKKRAYDAKQRGEPGRLRYNQAPAVSNAKILLWDDIHGFRGVVGTHDWLINPTGNEHVVFGIKVSHPAILSVLSWCAAGFWSRSQSETLSSVPDRWRRIAVDLESKVTDAAVPDEAAADSVTIKIILDREHVGLLHDWIASAQMRVVIASNRLDSTAEKRLSRLFKRQKNDAFFCRILFHDADLPTDSMLALQELVQDVGGALRYTSSSIGNAIVSDRSVCISSSAFLSGTPDFRQGARELGLIIEGSESVDRVASEVLRTFEIEAA